MARKSSYMYRNIQCVSQDNRASKLFADVKYPFSDKKNMRNPSKNNNKTDEQESGWNLLVWVLDLLDSCSAERAEGRKIKRTTESITLSPLSLSSFLSLCSLLQHFNYLLMSTREGMWITAQLMTHESRHNSTKSRLF